MNKIEATPKGAKAFLTKQEVATLLCVTPRTVNNWLTARLLPCYRRGGVLRFRQDEIETTLASWRVPAAGEPKRRAGRIAHPTEAS